MYSEVVSLFYMCIIVYEEVKFVKGFKYENNYVNDKYYLLLSIINSC